VRVVFDSVVFVRALLNPFGPAGRLAAHEARFDLITSSALIAELLAVLSRPAIRAKTQSRWGGPSFDLIARRLERAEIFEPQSIERVCRDPNDDKLFACAAAANADFIVSDDNDVLAVGEYRGTKTITTLDFLRLLEEPDA
jgi:putative PIN family toxin of toxin-antitoxin system